MELLIRLSCGGSVRRGQINELPVKKREDSASASTLVLSVLVHH